MRFIVTLCTICIVLLSNCGGGKASNPQGQATASAALRTSGTQAQQGGVKAELDAQSAPQQISKPNTQASTHFQPIPQTQANPGDDQATATTLSTPGPSNLDKNQVETSTKEDQLTPVVTNKPGTVQDNSAGSKNFDIDLAKADLEKVLVDKIEDENITHYMYHPNGATHILSVNFGPTTLWTAGYSEKLLRANVYQKKGSSSLVHLYIKSSGKEVHKYFEKGSDSYTELGMDDFRAKHEELLRSEPAGPTDPNNLRKGSGHMHDYLNVIDIQNPDKSLCKTFECVMDDVDTLLCVPFWGLSEVKCGSTSLWQAEDDKRCTLLKIHYDKDKKPVMIHATAESCSEVVAYSKVKDKNKWKNVHIYDKELKNFATTRNSVNGFVLDVMDVEKTEECDVVKLSLFGMSTVLFIPKPGFYTTRVTYGDVQLYESNQSKCERVNVAYVTRYSSSISLMFIVVSDKDCAAVHFRIKKGDMLHSLDEETYFKLVKSMKTREVGFNYQTYDILSPDPGCKTVESSMGDIPAKLLIPPTGTCINGFTSGENMIWGSATTSEICAFAITYLKGGNPYILHLMRVNSTGQEEIYYIKGDDGWKVCIDPKKFLSGLRTPENPVNFELNLRSQKDERSHIVDMRAFVFPMMLFVPKANNVATSVKYGEEKVIGSVGKKERVAFAVVYFKDENPFLLYILLRDSSCKPEKKYYERKDNKWSSVTWNFRWKVWTIGKTKKENFNKKLGPIAVFK
ncbi:hypothetical protein BEWA_047260 [Theileria equi strain WA]|uniref:Signal peptide containing protein n=1 Tax=Theileria equi strain WA TaxID=1537102 RepID=L1LAD8_THEEQ|nr:hypothetical protein BEWA_047260 [Theileria equi strain WA]EKX72261.1 hypothetical protein BEWA_047260 [Theileria equi strain WA]|eukprot:XP_004831713.1 hypothetical protein BEWA_047260 [Theileria equi strain WA]